MADTPVHVYRAKYVLMHEDGSHWLLEDGEVAVRGDEIIYVGRAGTCPEEADEVSDLGHYLICPGFVNLHCHPGGAPLSKSLVEDAGTPGFYMSSLYEYGNVRSVSAEERNVAVQYSLVELLRSGCTTLVDMGSIEHIDLFRELGVRACLIPAYRSAEWYTEDGHHLQYRWDEEAGRAGLRENVQWVRELQDDDMIWSALGPAQVDTCSADLLRRTREAADELGCRIHIHAAQSHVEVAEMMRRTGMTALQFLDHVGLLGPDLVVAHCILTGTHPDSGLSFTRDAELLGRRGAHVAHCPWVFGRRGTLLHSFRRYLDDGVNVGLGTDTFPQDMVTEMRRSVVFGKAADNDPLAVSAADAFNAATIGGAEALGRSDLGRVQAGAKADLLFVDCAAFDMSPVRDPIRNLLYSAGSAAIDSVMIGGRFLVQGGSVQGLDERAIAAELQQIADRMWPRFPERDRSGRSADEMSPPTFPRVQ